MTLSNLAIRQAKATGKAYPPDLNGLFLTVAAAGGRTWHFRCHWTDKQKRTAVRLPDLDALGAQHTSTFEPMVAGFPTRERAHAVAAPVLRKKT